MGSCMLFEVSFYCQSRNVKESDFEKMKQARRPNCRTLPATGGYRQQIPQTQDTELLHFEGLSVVCSLESLMHSRNP